MTASKASLRYKITFFVLFLFLLCAATFLFFGLGIGKDSREEAQAAKFSLAGLEEDANLEITTDPYTGRVTSVTAKTTALNSFAGANTETVAQNFMNHYGYFFGLNNVSEELKPVEQKVDQLGLTHVWLDQEYQGIPVVGGQVAVHLDQQQHVKSANGKVVPNISLETTPGLSEDEAIIASRQYWFEQFGLENAVVVDSGLRILNKGILEQSDNSEQTLVYLVELYDARAKQHENYFVDAHNGELVHQITDRKNTNRRITDCTVYPSGSLNGCGLDQLISGSTWGRSEGQPARGVNPTYGGQDVDDLYDIVGSSDNYFAGKFGRNGANGQGGIGDGVYSLLTNSDGYTYLEGVGWSCPDAFNDGFSLNFCRGLVYTDIGAHEYGHSVVDTSISGGLTYQNEPGALHEAYSDIIGEAVENYRTGSSDWLSGASVNVPGMVGPIRSLIDPPSLNDSGLGLVYPDRHYHSGFYCGSGDGGGVHHNSTVVSHAAYLMAEGGSFNGCTIDAIGRDKEERIYYQALTNYFTTNIDFQGSYTALSSACTDLYGATSSTCIAARRAMMATEMNQAGQCSSVARVAPGCSDSANPSFGSKSPDAGATDVSVTSNVAFVANDDNSGINLSSLNVSVGGQTAISGGVFQAGFSGSTSGNHIDINPDDSFGNSVTVTIEAGVSDDNGNSVSESWSFTTEQSATAKYLESKGIDPTGTGEYRCGRPKQSSQKIQEKAVSLRKELEGATTAMDKDGIDGNNWSEYAELYVYCDYPIDALLRYHFYPEVVSSNLNWYVYRNNTTYKKNIFKTIPGEKNILNTNYTSYYAQLRTSLAAEKQAAIDLRAALDAKYDMNKLQINASNWAKVVNAYLYGGYNVGDVARVIYYSGKVVHPWMPKYLFEQTNDYKTYSQKPVPTK